MKLNVGCGKDVREGYVNLDKAGLVGVDVVHDIRVAPWPFPDDSFDEVLCYNVLEHVDDLPAVMDEVYRVTKVEGHIKVIVPYYNSYAVWNDPTHRRGFTYNTFRYFEAGCDTEHYCDAEFEVGRTVSVPSVFGKVFPEPLRRALSCFVPNIVIAIKTELRPIK